jgi:hypothetical protein
MQAAQLAPLAPQLCLVEPALQVPSAAQQPVQVAGSHTQPFAVQRWPT